MWKLTYWALMHIHFMIWDNSSIWIVLSQKVVTSKEEFYSNWFCGPIFRIICEDKNAFWFYFGYCVLFLYHVGILHLKGMNFHYCSSKRGRWLTSILWCVLILPHYFVLLILSVPQKLMLLQNIFPLFVLNHNLQF